MAYCSASQTFEGNLFKKGKINKAWKLRHFVLDEHEQKMEYYSTKQDADDNKDVCGTIDISVVHRIETISTLTDSQRQSLQKHKTILSHFIVENRKAKSDKSYSFQLVLSNRTYVFSAHDNDTFIAWLNEFCRIIYGGVLFEGFIDKLGVYGKSWKKRYFTLNKYKQMKYYSDKRRYNFLGFIDLNLCMLITNGKKYNADHKWTLNIHTPSRKWILCTTTKQEKYEWEKMIKAVRWEKLDAKSTKQCIQQNIRTHHFNAFNLAPINDHISMVASDAESGYLVHMETERIVSELRRNSLPGSLDQISNIFNPNDEDEKLNEFDGPRHDMTKEEIVDVWDISMVQNDGCVELEGAKKIVRFVSVNDQRWYNVFGSIITEKQIQYHWKMKIIGDDTSVVIGIMDTEYVDQYVNHNAAQFNQNHFAISKYGYGVDGKGNLQNGGTNGGKYCQTFNVGDVVDIYLDMKESVLWFGVNGEEWDVACKVHNALYKCCVALLGTKTAVELVSCDTYFYPQK